MIHLGVGSATLCSITKWKCRVFCKQAVGMATDPHLSLHFWNTYYLVVLGIQHSLHFKYIGYKTSYSNVRWYRYRRKIYWSPRSCCFPKCKTFTSVVPIDGQLRYVWSISYNRSVLCAWMSLWQNYNDVIMSAMASQNTSLTIVYSTIYSGADQRKH